jgi:mitochondrial import inner membrane translocase subunit TIM16
MGPWDDDGWWHVEAGTQHHPRRTHNAPTTDQPNTFAMAPVGPLARFLAQVVVPVIAVVAKALPEAYAQALANARKSGVEAAAKAQQQQAANGASSTMNPLAAARNRISREEALQVLNLSSDEIEKDPQRILQQYEKYMAANEVKKGGGSFYLQSKVYRAKEMLEEYLEAERQDQARNASPDSSARKPTGGENRDDGSGNGSEDRTSR